MTTHDSANYAVINFGFATPSASHHKTYQADEKRMDEQGQIPESVNKLTVKAKDACERLLKDGSKPVALLDMSGGVKDAYKSLSQRRTLL